MSGPEGPRPARNSTLGQVFDPRNNALNAWRLILAVSVIFWHSWPLTGRTITYRPFEQLIEQVGVDGFNAVWTSPDTLPRPAEITDPQRWVARVHG